MTMVAFDPMLRRCLPLLIILAACSAEDEPGAPPPPPRSAVIDAAPVIDAPPVPTPTYDPASGYHLDDDGSATARRPEREAPRRERRWLQLMLVSSPSGAIAAVDGRVVGRTPVYWEGEFNGLEREFTFVLPGYTIGRYRFVPLQDGFVHGTLQRVTVDGDAGIPEIPVPLPPGPLPTAPVAPARRPRPAPPPPPPIDAAPPADAAPVADAAAVDAGV
jgi:hypothetical protein